MGKAGTAAVSAQITGPELLRHAIGSDEGSCIVYIVVNPGF